MKQFFLLSTALFSLLTSINAQNSSPYWSLAGNSNASGSSKFGTTNSNDLKLYTNNSERMRITSAGDIGVGTSSLTAKFTVNSASGKNPLKVQINGSSKLFVSNTGGVSVGSSSTPPSNGLYVAGNVGIGTTSPNSKLHVVSSSGNGIYTSGVSFGIQATATDADYGYGVTGNSNYIGVYGSSGTNGTYGTAGYSGNVGAYGSGGSYGVYGTANESAGGGVYGEGHIGVYGYNSASSGFGMYSTAYGQNSYGNYTYSASSTAIYAATGQSNGYGGVFIGNVYSSGNYVGSDRTLKKDITDLNSGLDIILKLKPKTYNYRQDGNYKLMNLPQGMHYGLIAQDVEQMLPGMVKATKFDAGMAARVVKSAKDSTPVKSVTAQPSDNIEFKAVNYTELIPIIIKGMQEQQIQYQQQNTEKDKKIADLQNQINELKSLILKNGGSSTTTSLSGYLKQNTPNPSNNNTIISYFTPDNTKIAQILITDMKGSVLKSYNVSRGEGMVNISNGELPAGTYNYTLYVNSNKIDTKQMLIIR